MNTFYESRYDPDVPYNRNLASRLKYKIITAARPTTFRKPRAMCHNFVERSYQHLPVYNFRARGINFSKLEAEFDRPVSSLCVRANVHEH